MAAFFLINRTADADLRKVLYRDRVNTYADYMRVTTQYKIDKIKMSSHTSSPTRSSATKPKKIQSQQQPQCPAQAQPAGELVATEGPGPSTSASTTAAAPQRRPPPKPIAELMGADVMHSKIS